VDDLQVPRARYQQVADHLREAILAGQYRPGDALPSQPELARRHGLNQTSINRAIAQLRHEGLVRVERGKGAYVQDIPAVGATFGERVAELRRRRGQSQKNLAAEVGRSESWGVAGRA
jgi:DNA-binding GntR family transcriptional regulator